MRGVIRIAIIAAVLVQGAGTLDAETLTRSTWQGIRTCQGPGGCTSTETEWQGVTTGRDNRGNEWTTSHWNGLETTTTKHHER
jgi:hypothetical protein